MSEEDPVAKHWPQFASKIENNPKYKKLERIALLSTTTLLLAATGIAGAYQWDYFNDSSHLSTLYNQMTRGDLHLTKETSSDGSKKSFVVTKPSGETICSFTVNSDGFNTAEHIIELATKQKNNFTERDILTVARNCYDSLKNMDAVTISSKDQESLQNYIAQLAQNPQPIIVPSKGSNVDLDRLKREAEGQALV